MTIKHLATGSQLPPYNGKLRVFSMRFCPYAQRLHLVLNAKNVPYDVVYVNLTEKPEWLPGKSPFGKVPALEIEDGLMIYESLVTAEYVDDKYPQNPLTAKDPLRKAQDKLIIEHFNKPITAYYKVLFQNVDTYKDIMEGLEEVQDQLLKRSTKFLNGDTPGMVDYMIWPWFERFPILTDIKGENYKIESGKFSTLLSWINDMKNDPAVKQFYLEPKIHSKFMKGRINGENNYDNVL